MLSNNSNRIPFGVKNNMLVDVSEVESGLVCDCTCPNCSAPLQARKGEVNQHHFSHDPNYDFGECYNACESSIHLMAKQIIEEERSFFFPEFKVTEQARDVNGKLHKESLVVQKQMRPTFDEVRKEVTIEDIRPDIVAKYLGQNYLIEVAVTHPVNATKKAKLRRIGLPTIEIKLNTMFSSKSKLKETILEELKFKTWLFHHDEERLRAIAKKKLAMTIRSIPKSAPLYRKKGKVTKTFQERYSKRPLLAPAEIKQFSTRQFLCEACRNIWSYTDVSYTVTHVECPHCSHHASAG